MQLIAIDEIYRQMGYNTEKDIMKRCGIKHRLMAALPSWLFTLVAGVSYVRCAVLARVLPGARRIRYRDKLPQKRKVLASSPARVIGRPARVVRRDVDWAAYGKGFV